MNKHVLVILVLTVSLLIVSQPLPGHHSTAGFDMDHTIAVKGTVTKFEWSNPHAYIDLDVKDEKGNSTQWSAELGSLGMLARVGWRRDVVKPGDQITAYGNRAKDGRTFVHLTKIVFADGRELSAQVL